VAWSISARSFSKREDCSRCREKSEEISELRPVFVMIVAALVPGKFHG
jgi:hypothetical protein